MISARGAPRSRALTGTCPLSQRMRCSATHLSPPYSRSPLPDLPVEVFRFQFDPDRRKFCPFAHTNTHRDCRLTNSRRWKRHLRPRACCYGRAMRRSPCEWEAFKRI